MARSKRTPSHKIIQPTPPAGVLPNSVFSSYDKADKMILLDFAYTPVGTRDSYIVARVHLTPEVAKWVRDDIDRFLKEFREK